jgi:transposase
MARSTIPEKVVKEIQRRTRRKFSSEEKVRVVLEGLRGEESIAELCRKEGISPQQYYTWSKEFLEAGKKRLSGDTEREATSTEVSSLRKENEQLKAALAESILKTRVLKESLSGMGADSEYL